MPGTVWSRPAARVVALFALALLVRLLFTAATGPDRMWPYGCAFKGDAVVWLRYAWSLQDTWNVGDVALQQRFELGLPLRPPATGYLLAWLWDRAPASVPMLRTVWSVLGALLAPLLYAGTRRTIGEGAATFAGVATALSTGLIMLSSSLDSETPYLLIATAAVVLTPRLVTKASVGMIVVVGALHGVACLFRVEHTLFAMFLVMWTWRQWHAHAGMRLLAASARSLAMVVVALAVTVPWHVHAFAQVERFAREDSSPIQTAGALPWSVAARAEIDTLPGFVRGSAFATIDAIVRHRGGTQVDVADLAVLEEATGSWPEPLANHPWIAIYGPLNFALANHPGASGGFDRALLDAPPPMRGGRDQYPKAWLDSLPQDGALALQYPPHLHLLNHGYREGLGWIANDLGAWLALVARKLTRAWSGLAHGLGGLALPLGPGGVRRAVDMLVPQGWHVLAWQVLVLLALVLSLRPAWANSRAHPFLLWLAAHVVVTVAFFGYARVGAMAVPAAAVVLGLGGAAWLRTSRRLRAWRTIGMVIVALVVGAEVTRWVAGPRWVIDDRVVTSTDPWPADLHVDREVGLRW